MTLQNYFAGSVVVASLFTSCGGEVYAPTRQDSRPQEESVEKPRGITIEWKTSPFTIYSDSQLRDKLELGQATPYNSLTATADQLTILNPSQRSTIPTPSDTIESYSVRKQNLTDQDTFYISSNGSELGWILLDGRSNYQDMFLANDFKFPIAGRKGQNTLELLTANPNKSEILYTSSKFIKN